MAEILMSRQGDKLIPHDALASEDVQRLGNGPFMVNVITKRSTPFDRLYRGCLASICKSGGFDDGPDILHDVTKMSCGHFKVIQMNGVTFRVPDSIAHAKMDAATFREFFDRAISFWQSEGLYQWIKPELRQQLEEGER